MERVVHHMSTTATINLSRSLGVWDAQVSRKALVAATGVILFGFVLVHMVGNLQIFLPAAADGSYAIDHYGELLHSKPSLLWVARIVLLTSVLLHLFFSFQLWWESRSARPVKYNKKDNSHSNYASRTMIWSGPIVGSFVIYHLLHFTVGVAHPQFQYLSVHHNVVTGFQQPLASAFYILANILLATHLYHGLWSMFQTVGLNHPRYDGLLKTFARLFAIVIGIGNVSIPVAVLAGIIQ
jgi:succinate dehydrogenase / fumarate reductase cytochrome b subunit